MSEQEEARLDPIVEDDVRRGNRVKEVPEHLQAELREWDIPVFTHIKMTRLNPARRRKITEVVQRAYHKDLRDTELLSNDQVMKLVVDRGEWSPDMDKRMRELGEKTTAQMAGLYSEGATKSREWLDELTQFNDRITDIVDGSAISDEEKRKYSTAFARWRDYHPDSQALYRTLYPDALKEGVYFPDSDLSWLMDNAPTMEVADMLDDYDELAGKIRRYLELVAERTEFEELRVKKLRMFANTVESRRDNAEEMARVYFSTERSDADGNPQGLITATFESLYDFPDAMITWLIEEQFFFHNAIPDETREFLSAFGFLTAEAPKTEAVPPQTPTSGGPSEASAESPVLPSVSTDSPPLPATAAASTASATPTS
jgi:hypothetical protein